MCVFVIEGKMNLYNIYYDYQNPDQLDEEIINLYIIKIINN